jgi:isochorismate synthase
MVAESAFFKKIHLHLEAQLPFAAYRKPHENILHSIFQKDDALHTVTDFTESGFFFAPFDHHEKAILLPRSATEYKIYMIKHHSNPIPKTPLTHIRKVNAEAKEKYLQLVEKAVTAIKNNHFKKVVLSRKEELPCHHTNPIAIFKNLLHYYPTAFCYVWFHPKVGLWLGATPEMLLKIKDNQIETMSLAGTQLFEGTLNVAWSEKEKEEHQWVTDFIVNTLHPLTDELNIAKTETVKAGNVLHLKTKITARFQPSTFNFQQLLEALHPTPAVCGFPKEEAKQFILKNEGYNRTFYTGFLGEVNCLNFNNNPHPLIKNCTAELFVNLRCMQLQPHKAIVYGGGGITKDSNPEAEWQETVSKTQIMLNAIAN